MLTQCAGINLTDPLSPSVLISPNQMNTRLNQQFPVSKSHPSGIAKLEFADPVCSMVPEQEKVRVGLTTSVLSGLLGSSKSLGGRCQLACKVRYDKESRGVFLDQPFLEDFTLAGIPSNWTSGARQLANIVGTEYVERYPVYTLPSTFGTQLLKSITTESGGIRLKFGLV